jgi:rod shape-determining protein MreC
VEADLKQGDLLISTGMGGVFPPGYPIAEVTQVVRNASTTFALVDARPTARLDRDREVLLVWFDPPAAVEQPSAAEMPPTEATPTEAAPAATATATAAPAPGDEE